MKTEAIDYGDGLYEGMILKVMMFNEEKKYNYICL